MANGNKHRLVAAIAIGSVCACTEIDKPEKSARPIVGAALATGLTNLPDILEPAFHPNHRQFFHSLTFAGMVGLAAYKLYKWQPTNPGDEALRFVLLVGAGSYLIHLLLDAKTPKSLPLIGRL